MSGGDEQLLYCSSWSAILAIAAASLVYCIESVMVDACVEPKALWVVVFSA
jgi:hypothetical protein